MTRLTTAAALMLCSAAPLRAEISAADVWQQWQEVSAVYGMDLAAEETAAAGGLKLEHLQATLDFRAIGRLELQGSQIKGFNNIASGINQAQLDLVISGFNFWRKRQDLTIDHKLRRLPRVKGVRVICRLGLYKRLAGAIS